MHRMFFTIQHSTLPSWGVTFTLRNEISEDQEVTGGMVS
jgi:hypothetical protein